MILISHTQWIPPPGLCHFLLDPTSLKDREQNNLPSGRILASLLFTVTGSFHVSAGIGLLSKTKIEPDRRLKQNEGSEAGNPLTSVRDVLGLQYIRIVNHHFPLFGLLSRWGDVLHSRARHESTRHSTFALTRVLFSLDCP